jgi:hypothetical protein
VRASVYGSVSSTEVQLGVLWFGAVLLGAGILAVLALAFPRRAGALSDRAGATLNSSVLRPGRDHPAAAFFIALSFLVYAGAFRIGFHSDDFAWQAYSAISASNPHHIFSLVGGLFKPLTHLYHLAHYMIFGPNPHLYHLTAVVLHGLNSFLVFLLGTRLAGDRTTGLLAGLLFVAYPPGCRSVMWISGSEILPAGTLLLLSLLVFLAYLSGGRRGLLILGALLFATGLLAKEATVSLAATAVFAGVLLGDGKRRWSGLVYIAVALPYLLFQGQLQSEGFLVGKGVYRLDPRLMLANLGGYAWSSVVPLGHRLYEDVPLLRPVAQLAAPAVLAVLAVKGTPTVRFLALSFPAMLMPFLPFDTPVNPRYLYLPSIVLCLMLALLLRRLQTMLRARRQYGTALFALGVALVLAFGAALIHLNSSRMARQSDAMYRYLEDAKGDAAVLEQVREGQVPEDSPLTFDHLRAALQAEGVLELPAEGPAEGDGR